MLLKLLIFLVSVCKLYCTITFLIFNPKKLTNTSHFVQKLNFSSFPFPTTLAPFDCTVKNPTAVRILILDMRFLWFKLGVSRAMKTPLLVLERVGDWNVGGLAKH
jgi:hypothetical protein